MPQIQKSQQVDITKVDTEQRIVYGTFLVSDKEDCQGDIITKEELEKTAHTFMLEYQNIGEVHKSINDQCKIIESYIDKSDDSSWAWKGAVKVLDDDVWDKIKSGEYASFSVGGVGIREAI